MKLRLLPPATFIRKIVQHADREIGRFGELRVFSVPTNFQTHVNVAQPIIIVGAGRSGTTLLFNILQQHPDTIPTVGLPDGEDTKMWVTVAGAKMAGFGGKHNRFAIGSTSCESMTKDMISEDRVQFLHSYLMKRYPRLCIHQKRLLNKNPHLSNKLGFVERIFPAATILHIVRNPYSVVESFDRMLRALKHLIVEIPVSESGCLNIYPKATLPLGVDHKRIYNPADESRFSLLAQHWANVNRFIMKQLLELKGLNHLTIRYEDLCDREEITLKTIYECTSLSSVNGTSQLVDHNRKDKYKLRLTEKQYALIQYQISDVAPLLGYSV